MTRSLFVLLAGCLLGCPHDFDRARQDVASPDVVLDTGRPDLPAPVEDSRVFDAWVQLDVVPTPDAGCPLPCVTTLPDSFKFARGVAVGGGGEVYISATGSNEIWVHANGSASSFAGTGTAACVDDVNALARFMDPSGLAVDGSGTVFVGDYGCNTVRFISGGQVSTLAGDGYHFFADGPADQASFAGPRGVAVDGSGTVYVADYGNNRIRIVANKVVSTLAGSTNGFADGEASTARFWSPSGVALDSAGAVYVADSSNDRIRVIQNGMVSTLAGGPEGYLDGPALNARFDSPSGVAVDSAGTVYVADSGNNRIRAISGGAVTTLAGDGVPAVRDGTGVTARFNNPYGLALNSSGTLLYVASNESSKIRVIQLK